jgi:hypothetical protein
MRTSLGLDLSLASLGPGAGFDLLSLSPLGWWRGDSLANDGSTWADKSGNGYSLSPVNSPAVVSSLNGRRGASFLAASSQSFARASSPVVGQPLTMAFVALAADPDSRTIGGSNSGDSANIFYLAGPECAIYAGAGPIGATLPVGSWRLYVAIFNGGSSAIYVDGTLLASGNPSTGGLAGFVVGAGPFGTPFDGIIAEAAVWNKALDAGEIAALTSLFQTYYAISPASSGSIADDFERVSLGSNWLVLPDGNSAPNYTLGGGILETINTATLMWQANQFPPDHWSKAIVANSAGGHCSPVVRVVPLGNGFCSCYYAHTVIGETAPELGHAINGTLTTVGAFNTLPAPVAIGDEIELACVGDAFTLKVNGTARGTIHDSTLTGAGSAPGCGGFSGYASWTGGPVVPA